MKVSCSLVWFRHDLRLADNPALSAAIESGQLIVPVFVWTPEEEGSWQPASASRWWLHQSLKALSAELKNLGSKLILRRGPAAQELKRLADEVSADRIYWNRRYEPEVIARDKSLKSTLKEAGMAVESHNSALLFEPWTIENKQGKPFQVYTPFWNACRAEDPPAKPAPRPAKIPALPNWPNSVSLESLELEPKIDWASGFRKAWTPGEAGAMERLEVFLERGLSDYADQRDRPDVEGTSAISPHLHFGEISPRTIWHRVLTRGGCAPTDKRLPRGVEVYLKELVWREFAHHLLYHFPHTTDEPLRSDFERFPWRDDDQALHAWQKGRTGYPFVDAGMRQLWATGWMHNRVRMVVASFLVKHLLIPWQCGAEWFWDTLVDADLASNTLGWQWTAGCGADAAPYFRVFNPITQGEKFDPQGEYVRQWIPELAKLSDKVVHAPWQASDDELRRADVKLGETYPRPIVDHAEARERALQAYEKLKTAKK